MGQKNLPHLNFFYRQVAGNLLSFCVVNELPSFCTLQYSYF